jgi:hypothetical protein
MRHTSSVDVTDSAIATKLFAPITVHLNSIYGKVHVGTISYITLLADNGKIKLNAS